MFIGLSSLKNFLKACLLLAFVGVTYSDVDADPDLDDHPGFAHAMQVETRKVDGFPVVFHYGQVRPDFDDVSENSHRKRFNLNGEWLFRFDPQSIGIPNQWFLAAIPIKGWQNIKVPHCWDMMAGGEFWNWKNQSVTNPPHYNGAAWYRRSFDWTPNQGMRQRIVFLGVQQRARIFLNGSEIAMHEGGGAPFSVDGPSQDGKKWEEINYTHTMYPKAPDCWPYAGILRDVILIEEPEISIRKTQIYTEEGQLHASVVLSNHGKKTTNVQVRLKSDAVIGNGDTVNVIQLNPGQTRVVKMVASLNHEIKRWSTESPTLYKALITLHHPHGREMGQAFDQLQTQFGIRTFTTDGPHFKLNDSPIFLKGVSMYEESDERGGALTPADHENLFKLARESGSNFIRMHVIQRDPYAYQLADKRGILICAEWGGFWYREKSMDHQTKDPHSMYQTMARCAVWDLMNHPSVVMWGLHNESHQFGPEYEEFVKMGRSLVREIDFEKRPVTWAAWHPTKGQPHFEYADAVGFNEYRGALDPFEDLDPDMKKVALLHPNKPLIILENGAWAKLGKRGRVTQKGTEDWQADLLKRQWEVLTKHSPAFAGYTYWLLVDYRARKTYTANKRSDGYSAMGLYDPLYRPKLVKDVFKNLKTPSAP